MKDNNKECCENCRHLVRLKYDFKVGKGYKNSWACVALIDTEPIQERDKYTFVVEVSKESDMCELWHRKSS